MKGILSAIAKWLAAMSAPSQPPAPTRAEAAMKIATAFVEQFEGYSAAAYHDPTDRPDVWTIGFGSITINGRPVRSGDVVTRAQADAMMAAELAEKAAAVEALAPADATPNECAALYSFAYNVGIGAMQGSTLVRLWREGNRPAAAEQFGFWTYSNGKRVPGLVNRREAERRLFLGLPAS